jgi:hypothetical protein
MALALVERMFGRERAEIIQSLSSTTRSRPSTPARLPARPES